MTWLLGIAVILLVAYELYAAITTGDLTISQLIWRASTRTPAVPFFFGLLMGHLFLSR